MLDQLPKDEIEKPLNPPKQSVSTVVQKGRASMKAEDHELVYDTYCMLVRQKLDIAIEEKSYCAAFAAMKSIDTLQMFKDDIKLQQIL